ncbi:MAG: 50S ribosomal protein L22 [Clostridium sp.]|nr:50S ribosomal protein L22 [Clostridium sp.]
MEAKAVNRNERMSQMKADVVLDLVRGKNVNEAMAILEYTNKRSASVINKTVKSAVANAENNLNLDRDNLYISEAYTGQGPTLKRFRPRAQGRAFRILKRTTNITIVVKER